MFGVFINYSEIKWNDTKGVSEDKCFCDSEMFEQEEEALKWIVLNLTKPEFESAFDVQWAYSTLNNKTKHIFTFSRGSNRNAIDVYRWIVHNNHTLDSFVANLQHFWKDTSNSIKIMRESRKLNANQSKAFNTIQYDIMPNPLQELCLFDGTFEKIEDWEEREFIKKTTDIQDVINEEINNILINCELALLYQNKSREEIEKKMSEEEDIFRKTAAKFCKSIYRL